MTDLSKTVAPKSDQLNADDLIAGPRTIRITRVRGVEGEQPIAIDFEGDNGRPFKPCKSMRRVLMQVWGSDGNQFPGRSMTIYRDPDVQYGGLKVGGIRISHMSHIERDTTLILTATQKKRVPYVVAPLADAPPPAKKPDVTKPDPERIASALVARVDATHDGVELMALMADDLVTKQRAWLRKNLPAMAKRVDDAIEGKRAALEPPPADDDFPGDRP